MKKTSVTNAFLLAGFLCNSAFSQVEFYAVPQSGCAPLTVEFTNTTGNTNAYYYWWNFGDGTPDIFDTLSTTMLHTYSEPGNYWAWLEARDSMYNYIGSGNFIVEVLGVPQQFNLNADSACPGEELRFELQGSYSYLFWDFGDSTYSNSQYPGHSYADTGTYLVTLIATSSICSETDTLQQEVHILNNVPVPAIPFIIEPGVVCPGDLARFNIPWELANLSFYEWDYGDGNSFASPYYYEGNSHGYANTGDYTVTLTISNACGNFNSVSDTVHVENNVPMYGYFYLDAYNLACPGDVVGMNTGYGYQEYIWDYGDGNIDTTSLNYTNHIYSDTGKYDLSVTIFNGCGNDTTLFSSVNISNNNPITENFNIYASSPACPGDMMQFDVYPGDGYGFLWDFGDGNFAPGRYVTHSYASPGNYTVSLTVTNGCGNDSVFSQQVTVQTNLPVDINNFEYGFTADTACPGDSVIFWTWPSTGNYLWDFGDGNTGVPTGTIEDAKIIYYAYSTLGNYTVALTLTNGCGNSVTDSSMMITIGNNTPAAFIAETVGNPDSICVGKPIEIVAFGSGTSFTWYFGDGDSAISTSPGITHTYSAAGVYTLILEGINGCGNSGSDTLVLIIDQCIVGITEPYPVNENFPAVYPNPSDGIFTLQMQSNEISPVTVSCIDIIGQKTQLMQNVTLQKGNAILRFDLNRFHLSEGIYIIEVKSGNEPYRLKLMITDNRN